MSQTDKMYIAISLNSKYMHYAYVMLTSLFIQHPDTLIHVFALHMDLSDTDREYLKYLSDKYNNTIDFINILPEDFPKSLPTTEMWSLETYFRLQLIDKLPLFVDRILYLDIDMIISGSLTELYQQDFENNLFCVCKDMSTEIPFTDIRAALFHPLYHQGFVYFNAGIMLWNIAALRGHYSFDFYMKLARDLNYQILAPDQDLLNFTHWNQVKFVDEYKYDLFARLAYNRGITYEDVKREVHVVHFAGFKPWCGEYVHYNIEKLWWDYAKLTPFYHDFLEEFLESCLTSTTVQDTVEKLIQDKQDLKAELDKTATLCQKLYSMLSIKN